MFKQHPNSKKSVQLIDFCAQKEVQFLFYTERKFVQKKILKTSEASPATPGVFISNAELITVRNSIQTKQ